MKDPRFIFVGDGKTDDLLWVEIDGDASSVNPARLKQLFPELVDAPEITSAEAACATTTAARQQVRSALDAASAVIADSPSVCRVYTLDAGMQARVLERAKAYQAGRITKP